MKNCGATTKSNIGAQLLPPGSNRCDATGTAFDGRGRLRREGEESRDFLPHKSKCRPRLNSFFLSYRSKNPLILEVSE